MDNFFGIPFSCFELIKRKNVNKAVDKNMVGTLGEFDAKLIFVVQQCGP